MVLKKRRRKKKRTLKCFSLFWLFSQAQSSFSESQKPDHILVGLPKCLLIGELLDFRTHFPVLNILPHFTKLSCAYKSLLVKLYIQVQ